jgi:septum formation protein
MGRPTPSRSDSALPLVLASASPRRRELLARAGVGFEVVPAEIEELAIPGEAPADLAARLAREKALAVARRLGSTPARLVLGADTIVVLGEAVLGKPVDAADAERLLGLLAGRRHRVLTAVALVASDRLVARALVVESRVAMRAASADEIRRYVAGGEPLDKAGAYAAQGEGRRFIEHIEGSESNVIGLPLEETLALLDEAGWREGER